MLVVFLAFCLNGFSFLFKWLSTLGCLILWVGCFFWDLFLFMGLFCGCLLVFDVYRFSIHFWIVMCCCV